MNKQDSIDYKYYFNQTDNIVELEWYDNITDCKYMFIYCYNITEINMSNFNTSLVNNMNQMFADCVNLEYINLNNFNDSKTGSIFNMFKSVQKNTVICLKELNTQ